MELELCHRLADGIVIWSRGWRVPAKTDRRAKPDCPQGETSVRRERVNSEKKPWDPEAAWWKETVNCMGTMSLVTNTGTTFISVTAIPLMAERLIDLAKYCPASEEMSGAHV